MYFYVFFFQAEDGIRDAQESRGLGDVYKRQFLWDMNNEWMRGEVGTTMTMTTCCHTPTRPSLSPFFDGETVNRYIAKRKVFFGKKLEKVLRLALIRISSSSSL
eukprot:TRINITY_DN65044_c0_g2_i1.p1 TRINITY_DN65044_c0_g2~~TRINITY_DN65044_c0_g2_i1.p1  ORF type:complete len:104 (+),score=7.47 TRINITY_DN65044_c0_g2_i1:32-343(+)